MSAWHVSRPSAESVSTRTNLLRLHTWLLPFSDLEMRGRGHNWRTFLSIGYLLIPQLRSQSMYSRPLHITCPLTKDEELCHGQDVRSRC